LQSMKRGAENEAGKEKVSLSFSGRKGDICK
jgi:hypothetical protein